MKYNVKEKMGTFADQAPHYLYIIIGFLIIGILYMRYNIAHGLYCLAQ